MSDESAKKIKDNGRKADKKPITTSKKIVDNYEKQKQRYLEEGYEEKQETISVMKANVMAFVTAGPFAIIEVILWIFIGKNPSGTFSVYNSIVFFVLLMVCVVIHELLHGAGWSIWTEKKWKSIHLGVMWEYLTPYCHCKEPLTPGRYLFGGLMPFMVLGIGFYAAAAVLGNTLLLLLSICNVLSAGGDTTIACMMLKYLRNHECYILDHPTECGFVAFVKKQ